MSFHWLTWSNPVALWWGFLLAVSVVNVILTTSASLRLSERRSSARLASGLSGSIPGT
jgi:hypothetical protein